MGYPNGRACCNTEGNVVEVSRTRAKGELPDGRPIKGYAILRQCQVCKAKHHVAELDPVKMSTKGQGA